MNDDAQSHPQCAWCTRPVPDVADVMTAVRAADGVTLVTCGAVCLAELVAVLTGGEHIRVGGMYEAKQRGVHRREREPAG